MAWGEEGGALAGSTVPPIDTKAGLFAAIRTQGWEKARVEFSGGNDSGGCEGFEVWPVGATAWQKVDVTFYDYGSTTTPPPADLIARALDAYLDQKYGSFAGDFYVWGHVEADVAAGTVRMVGSEDYTESRDIEEEFED